MGNVGNRHVQVPKNVRLLRIELDYLIWVAVPTALIARLAIDLNPAEMVQPVYVANILLYSDASNMTSIVAILRCSI